jgi:hypothetical protein
MALEKEDIMALIAILQKGLTDDETELLYEEDTSAKTATKKKRSARKTKSKPNKFDAMSERNMHKSDTEIDKKLWGKNTPSDRGRPSSMISVRCRVCGQNQEVSSALVESVERYKCNKCASSSG